jgi:predicted RNase H-like nuclease
VFFAPTRGIVERPAEDYASALRWMRDSGEDLMSAQAFGIVAKVRDVDTVLTREIQNRVIEAHPELSFRAMARADDLPSKKSAPGAAHRLVALRTWIADVTDQLAGAPGNVPVDDALDALACAWTAERFATGRAETLGGDEDDSDRGLLMRIVT